MLLKQFAKKINNEKGKYYCEQSVMFINRISFLQEGNTNTQETERSITTLL